MRTKECEVQYNLARFEQQKKDAEKQSANSRALNAQVSTFSQTESELRSQLNIYVEKFKQVCRAKFRLQYLLSTSFILPYVPESYHDASLCHLSSSF